MLAEALRRLRERTPLRHDPQPSVAGQRTAQRPKPRKTEDKKTQEAFDRLVETVHSLEAHYQTVWGSLVKQTVKRVYPGFDETYYGYRNFSDLLEQAAKEGLIALELDEQRGNYRVRSLH